MYPTSFLSLYFVSFLVFFFFLSQVSPFLSDQTSPCFFYVSFHFFSSISSKSWLQIILVGNCAFYHLFLSRVLLSLLYALFLAAASLLWLAISLFGREDREKIVWYAIMSIEIDWIAINRSDLGLDVGEDEIDRCIEIKIDSNYSWIWIEYVRFIYFYWSKVYSSR